MTTDGFLIVFYVVSAVALLLLLVRHFSRRRRERREIENALERHRRAQTLSPATMTRSAEGGPGEPEGASRTASARLGPTAQADASTQPTAATTAAVALTPEVDRDYVFGPLTPTLAALLPESEQRRQEICKELVQAGYYEPYAHENLSAVRYLGIIIPILVFGSLLVLVPRSLELPVLGLLVGVPLLAWALPRIYIKNKARERKMRIEHAMPDLLDMLNMCVSQGLTITQALKRVTHDFQTVYPDLAQELGIVCEQAEVGSLQHALNAFRERVDVPEVHSFATLLIQTERMGTSVSEALIQYSNSMRESMRQRADEKANQASFKLMFPTVLCLMPAVLLILLGPAVVELSNFFDQGGGELLNNQTEVIENLSIDRR